MVFSFDRKRRRAMRRWKNWALSVARAGLPTVQTRWQTCGPHRGQARSHILLGEYFYMWELACLR
ncbi:hypothetical protein B5P22_28860 [Pseudomonas tolaasii]|nr:hypothetical protein B5P22_28860 [Pseudomonas tolaasii]